MIPISICLIAKNEEKNIKNCLIKIREHTEGHPSEVLVVDTGSTDSTKEIASQYADRILDFIWTSDFSAARNFSIANAKYEYVLILDCDEFIFSCDIVQISNLIAENPDKIGCLIRHNHFLMNNTDSVYIDSVERLFSKKHFHYEGTIHEQVHPIQAGPFEEYTLPLEVEHTGYMGTLEELQNKCDRDNELLFKQIETEPDNPYLYFQVGQSYNMLHNDKKASQYYEKALALQPDPSWEYVQMMIIAYGHNLLHMNQLDKALQLEKFYDDLKQNERFVCMIGLIYLRNGEPLKALPHFVHALTLPAAKTEDDCSPHAVAYYNIAYIYEAFGKYELAINYYQQCGNFPMAIEQIMKIQTEN